MTALTHLSWLDEAKNEALALKEYEAVWKEAEMYELLPEEEFRYWMDHKSLTLPNEPF